MESMKEKYDYFLCDNPTNKGIELQPLVSDISDMISTSPPTDVSISRGVPLTRPRLQRGSLKQFRSLKRPPSSRQSSVINPQSTSRGSRTASLFNASQQSSQTSTDRLYPDVASHAGMTSSPTPRAIEIHLPRRHSDTMLGGRGSLPALRATGIASGSVLCPHRHFSGTGLGCCSPGLPVTAPIVTGSAGGGGGGGGYSSQTSRERRSGLDSIGVDYLKINGVMSGFKQLKRAEEFITPSTKHHHGKFSMSGPPPETEHLLGNYGMERMRKDTIDGSTSGDVNNDLDLGLSLDAGGLGSGGESLGSQTGHKTVSESGSGRRRGRKSDVTSPGGRAPGGLTGKSTSSSSVGFRLGRRKELFEKRKRVSDYSLAFAIFGLMVMVIETELVMAKSFQKGSAYSNTLKCLVTISTVALIGLIFAYHVYEIKLFSCDDCIEDWRIAVTWPRVAQMTLEVIICSVHPIAGHFTFPWNRYMINQKDKTVTEISVDLLLSLPMFLRLYLIFRVMLLHSKLFTDAGSRSIGAMNKVNFDTRFVMKTLMTICPGTVLLVFILSMWIIFSWTMRACESYHDATQFANILNSMWLISVTFLSIGYGDIVPHTYCGRAIAISTGVMGSACTALVVAVFSRKLELSKAEKHVIHFMMENQLTKRVKNYAANVLRETWLIYKYTKLAKKVNPSKVRSHQRLFLRAIHGLRRMKIDQRKLQDNCNTLVDLAKTQTNIYETVTEVRVDQNCFSHRMDEIEANLIKLQEQLTNLPVVMHAALSRQSILDKSSSNLHSA